MAGADFWALLGEGRTLFPLLLTLRVSALVLPLHLLLGLAVAFLLCGRRNPLRWVLDLLVTLPMVFPPIAVGFFLLLLLGRQSFLGGLFRATLGLEFIFSYWGVVLASLVAGLPFIVKPVQSAVQGSAARLVEASYLLGKSRLTTFLRVLLPNIKRQVAAGLVLAFGRSLGEVGITLMLGGNVVGKTNTISLEIFNAVYSAEFDRALVLSVGLGLVAAGVFWLLKRLAAI